MQVECDIYAEPIQSGTWTRRGPAFVLGHASGAIAVELGPLSVMGCGARVRRGEQHVRVPGGVYVKQDDPAWMRFDDKCALLNRHSVS